MSEPAEVQQALATVSQAVEPTRESACPSPGFSTVASTTLRCGARFGRTSIMWCVGCTTPTDSWSSKTRPERGTRETWPKQARPKNQPVVVDLSTCPLRLSYWSNVRRPGGKGKLVTKPVWLVQVQVLGTNWEPWLLLTDWPQAMRIFVMYRQRWAVEDRFKVTKECLGWEEVQVLDLRGIRTLVAMAWVVAGFLYQLGVTLEWAEVHLLAK